MLQVIRAFMAGCMMGVYTLSTIMVVCVTIVIVNFSGLVNSNALTLLIGIIIGIWFIFCTYTKFSNKVLAKI